MLELYYDFIYLPTTSYTEILEVQPQSTCYALKITCGSNSETFLKIYLQLYFENKKSANLTILIMMIYQNALSPKGTFCVHKLYITGLFVYLT